MELMDAIRGRRSVRKFSPKKVEHEKIGRILEACKWAPSASNMQSWEVVVVDDKDKIEEFSKISLNQIWIRDAPLLMFICINQNRCGLTLGDRSRSLYCIQGTAAAAQNMMLAATDIGLATCWIDPYNEKETSKLLECPSHIKPMVCLAVGYPDKHTHTKVPHKHEINEFSYSNKFGENKYEKWQGYAKTVEKGKKKILESLKRF